jgi:iron(III) transport system permease protein
MRVAPRPAAWRSWLQRVSIFKIVVLLVALFIAVVLVASLVRLTVWAWDQYGSGIPSYYVHDIFGDGAVRQLLSNTAIVVGISSVLGTLIASILAWLNERTDASIGQTGRVLPLIPFLMPAIALPLGWIFLAVPQVGILNLVLRSILGDVGIHLSSGPLNIYSWPGMIFLYTVVLCGFAFLVLSGSLRNLDPGLEEAAQMAGARPLTILFRIVLPAMRSAVVGAFFLCVIVGLVMVSVPVTIGVSANIPILSVQLVDDVTTQFPPEYANAFLLGIMMLVPILLLWWLQHRVTRKGNLAVIGGKAAGSRPLRMGRRGRVVGRIVFLGYALIAVFLPLCGLIYVAGLKLWQGSWPSSWSLLSNVSSVMSSPQTRPAILWSLFFGLAGGAALIITAHILSYAQRMFSRFGSVVDGLAKSPAVVAQILLAIALLVTLGGAPFHLAGSPWLLFIGYVLVFLPFASVITTAAHQEIGKDLVEASWMAGASDFRTLRSVVTPLCRPALAGGFLLMFVIVSGETNISLILANQVRPVVGFEMVDLFNYGSFPQVASFALVVTAVNLICVFAFMWLVSTSSPDRVPRHRLANLQRRVRKWHVPSGAARPAVEPGAVSLID